MTRGHGNRPRNQRWAAKAAAAPWQSASAGESAVGDAVSAGDDQGHRDQAAAASQLPNGAPTQTGDEWADASCHGQPAMVNQAAASAALPMNPMATAFHPLQAGNPGQCQQGHPGVCHPGLLPQPGYVPSYPGLPHPGYLGNIPGLSQHGYAIGTPGHLPLGYGPQVPWSMPSMGMNLGHPQPQQFPQSSQTGSQEPQPMNAPPSRAEGQPGAQPDASTRTPPTVPDAWANYRSMQGPGRCIESAAQFQEGLQKISSPANAKAMDSAFTALGQALPAQANAEQPGDMESLLRQLVATLGGERKSQVPSWSGAPNQLRSWLKALGLWERETSLPRAKWGLRLYSALGLCPCGGAHLRKGLHLHLDESHGKIWTVPGGHRTIKCGRFPVFRGTHCKRELCNVPCEKGDPKTRTRKPNRRTASATARGTDPPPSGQLDRAAAAAFGFEGHYTGFL